MTQYVSTPEWLRSVPDEVSGWWEALIRGLHQLAKKHDRLTLKLTPNGFVHLRFWDVGLSNSQVGGGRNHVSLGYEQASTFEGRRARFQPVIEEWIATRSWGAPTDGSKSKYREQSVLDEACPAASQIVAELDDLLQKLAQVASG